LAANSERSRAAEARRLLINDEGNAALHFLNADTPSAQWTHHGPGRDLQLIGNHRVLRSHPHGYVELDLEQRGARLVDVTLRDLPGTIESARRLSNGNTVVAGNGSGGAFLWELDPENGAIPERCLQIPGIEKVRMVRRTTEGTYLFCSETDGRSLIHEADFETGCQILFEVPKDTPADSMVKAVRVSTDLISVSTGYAASLLRIDTKRKQVVATIGGKSSVAPPGLERPLSPFFFSGYQMFANGDYLVSNWQGHSATKNEQGYQLLRYDREGVLLWSFDQTAYPFMSSLNNVIALDGLDTRVLHDEPDGVLVPCV
jgi:hypothetical protein